jgi:hypothetical protein
VLGIGTPLEFPIQISQGGTGATDPADALAALGGISQNDFPQTALETAAGVTTVNTQYNNNPYDIRRYAGWNGNGVADDSAAWISLAAVVAKGGSGMIPPGPSYVANQVIFNVPPGASGVVYGYGVQLYTNNSPFTSSSTGNAIDGLQFTGGGNSDALRVLGITYYQIDALATNGFNIQNGSSITLEDCAVIVSSTLAANGGFSCFRNAPTGSGLNLWNKFINCDIRQITGNSLTWASYGILCGGIANATTIRDCRIGNTNQCIGISNLGSGSQLPNAVIIDSNHFEGAGTGIEVTGNNVALTQITGLRVTNNRAESLSGDFLLFYNLASDSLDVPTFLSGNYFISSIAGYIGQGSGPTISYTSLDFGLVPNYEAAGITTASPFVVTTQAFGGSSASHDAVQAVIQSAGGGVSVFNTTTQYATMFYAGGGAGGFNLPQGGGYQVSSTQVVGVQQTTGVASATLVANSGTALNSASTLDGYTLGQVVRALRLHGLLA